MPSFNQFLIEDTNPKDVKLNIDYHKELNPDIWLGTQMRDVVLNKLLRIAKEFFDFLEMPSLKVIDVAMTGSMANYNWNKRSDIDLHLIVELDENACDMVDFRDIFDTKKALWAELHDITIFGHDVELYVQLTTEDHTSTGIYSLDLNEWIDKPKHTAKGENVDLHSVKVKAAAIMTFIDKIIEKDGTITFAERVKKHIKAMRQSGLEKNGEFSIENLAFKTLRDNGYLEKLFKYIRAKKDSQLSYPNKKG
jgi:hypothetical protein